MSGRQGLVVLGATGSVGRSTLDVARRHPDKLEIHGLSAHRDLDGLLALCREFRPALAAIADDRLGAGLEQGLRAAGLDTRTLAGADALDVLVREPGADQVMAAVAGSPGLSSTLAALAAGKRVLIANKEPLVMAGALMMRTAAASGATVLPIDSEHNAIFQCLPPAARCGQPVPPGVRKVLLTASGGPFRETPLEQLAAVTPEQAVRHPNWSMGRKISVDSASMMNKGLEVIEACFLFGVGPQLVDVLIHPQSIVHSMVEYADGSVLAQMGSPDMRIPIAHCLAWPERMVSGAPYLDLTRQGNLQFFEPDLARFPCLKLGMEAARAGGTAPTILNAANEVAVESFLQGHSRFTDIPAIISGALEQMTCRKADSVDMIRQVDEQARALARRLIGRQ